MFDALTNLSSPPPQPRQQPQQLEPSQSQFEEDLLRENRGRRAKKRVQEQEEQQESAQDEESEGCGTIRSKVGDTSFGGQEQYVTLQARCTGSDSNTAVSAGNLAESDFFYDLQMRRTGKVDAESIVPLVEEGNDKSSIQNRRETMRSWLGNAELPESARRIKEECDGLRSSAKKQREELISLKHNFEMISEGSSSQGDALWARTLDYVARSGLLISKLISGKGGYDKVGDIVTKVAENYSYLKDKSSYPEILGLSLMAGVELEKGWYALNALESHQKCLDKLQIIGHDSHWLEKGLALGKCVKSTEDILKFIGENADVIKRAGRALGYVLDVGEMVNDLKEIRDIFEKIEDYSYDNPEKALEAWKRLDQDHRKIISLIKECDERFNAVMANAGR